MEQIENKRQVITAEDLATYVVCPEAWRLKNLEKKVKHSSERAIEGARRRQEMVEKIDLSATLRYCAKIAYLLLLALTAIVFLLERYRLQAESVEGRTPILPQEIFGLFVLLGIVILLWDFFDRSNKKLKNTIGIGEKSEFIALKGSERLPTKRYFSPQLGLASKPYALIKDKESGAIIPADIHPLAKKVKDRHVIQLLAHLRLIEELENKRPPYGLLILGASARPIRVKNSEDKQRWLEAILAEMNSIFDGVPAVPAPGKFKCKSCDVRSICSHSAYTNNKSEVSAEKTFKG